MLELGEEAITGKSGANTVPVRFREFANMELMVEEGTPGGDTYIVGDRRLCFRFLAQHHRAVRALTGDMSNHTKDIREELVQALIEQGTVRVDDKRCMHDHGYMGAVVYDADNTLIGEIGIRCAQTPGHRTDHSGYGSCSMHSFSQKMAHITTARESSVRRKSLADKIAAYAGDPNRLDLSKDLAVQRTMVDAMVDQLGTLLDVDAIWEEDTTRAITRLQEQIVRLSDLIGRQVERIVTIDQKHALSAGQVLYLQAVVIDIINTFIEDPVRRDIAARQLMERLGTGAALREAIGIEQLMEHVA